MDERPDTEPLPRSAIVAATTDGDVMVLDRSGARMGKVMSLDGDGFISAVSLSADRRTVFVGIRRPDDGSSNCTGQVLAAPASGGPARIVSDGTSPAALSNGKVAVTRLQRRNDICYRASLAVVDEDGHDIEAFALPEPVPDGTPPEQIVAASPNGASVAVVGMNGLNVLDLASGKWTRPGPRSAQLLAPAFADDSTLVAQQNCCIANMSLGALDRDGYAVILDALPAPLVAIDAGATAQQVVLVTALHELHLVIDGRLQKPIAEAIVAAAA